MSTVFGWAGLRGRTAAVVAAAAILLGASGAAAAPASAASLEHSAQIVAASAESDAAPTVTLDSSVIPANAGLVFSTSGWAPDVPVSVHISGPAELVDEVLPDADGGFVRSIEIVAPDASGTPRPDAQFPVGDYTLTLSQERAGGPGETAPSDDPSPAPSHPVEESASPSTSPTSSDDESRSIGESREVVSVQVNFTVEPVPGATTSASPKPSSELAATGAGEFAIVAGVAALVFVLGAVVVLIARSRFGHR